MIEDIRRCTCDRCGKVGEIASDGTADLPYAWKKMDTPFERRLLCPDCHGEWTALTRKFWYGSASQ